MRNKEAVLAAISAEMNRQDEKWGPQREHPDELWLTILVEEVGEIAESILEGDLENMCTEIVQVAAVAAQWALSVGCRE